MFVKKWFLSCLLKQQFIFRESFTSNFFNRNLLIFLTYRCLLMNKNRTNYYLRLRLPDDESLFNLHHDNSHNTRVWSSSHHALTTMFLLLLMIDGIIIYVMLRNLFSGLILFCSFAWKIDFVSVSVLRRFSSILSLCFFAIAILRAIFFLSLSLQLFSILLENSYTQCRWKFSSKIKMNTSKYRYDTSLFHGLFFF